MSQCARADRLRPQRLAHLVMTQTATATTTRRTPTPTPMGSSLLSDESDGVMAVTGRKSQVSGAFINQ